MTRSLVKYIYDKKIKRIGRWKLEGSHFKDPRRVIKRQMTHGDKWGHIMTHGGSSHILLWPGGHPITLKKYPSSSTSLWKKICPEPLLVQIQPALPVPLSYCCYQEIQFHCHHYFVIIIIVWSSSHHIVSSLLSSSSCFHHHHC